MKKTHGQIAYETFIAHSGDPAPLLKWEEMHNRIQEAWEVAAKAVRAAPPIMPPNT